MKKLQKILLLLLFTTSLMFAGEFRPDAKWSQYETEHFRLIFNDNSKYLADETFEFVEDIFELITTELNYLPKEKVDILFNDTSDLVLDYANYFSNTIMINTAKAQSAQLGPFVKSSLRNLIAHELTHIVHMQMSLISDGLYTFVKRTTSKGWAYPYFMIEGFAVFNEKYITGAGRLYNSSFNEQMMAFAMEDDFPTIHQAYQRAMLRWPRGNAPYLLGSKFVDYLVEAYGVKKLTDTYRFFVANLQADYKQSFYAIYGVSLESEYSAFVNYYKNLYLVQESDFQTPEPVISGGVEVKGSYFVSDKSYYAYVDDYKSGAKIFFVEGKDSSIVYENSFLYNGKIAARGDDMFFLKISIPNIYDSKVSLVKLSNGNEVIVADGVIDFDLNDDSLIYIKREVSKDILVIESEADLDLPDNTKELEAVAINSDGSVYAYIEQGSSDNVLILQDGDELSSIVEGDIKDLLFVDDELWFVAGIEGYSQLFKVEDSSLIQKTNILTGVYNPQVRDNQIFFSTYTSRGMDLVMVPNNVSKKIQPNDLKTKFKPVMKIEEILTDDEAVITNSYYSQYFIAINDLDAKYAKKETASYNMWNLKMMYLYPYLYADNYGTEVGVSTYLSDPLEFNTFAINFYGSTYGNYFNIQYLNQAFYPYFLLHAVKDGYNDSFFTGFDFPFRKDKFQQDILIGIKDKYDNEVLEQESYEIAYIAANIEKYPYSISYEKGFINQFTLDVSRTDSNVSVLDDLKLYLPGLDVNHVVKMEGLGGYSQQYRYVVRGIPGITYARGLDMNSTIKGRFLSKVSCEYRMPYEVVDDLSLFGFYHKQTAAIFFYDIADAVDVKEDILKNPYWSYGVAFEWTGDFNNFYPFSFGLGLGTASDKDAFMFFSFGTLMQ